MSTPSQAPAPAASAAPSLAVIPARWHLRLLGGFELADGRHRVTRLPSRAITLLLVRLAMGGARDHGREELIELLWPAVALDVGRNRLRQALSSLRSVLEPAEWPGATVLLADRRAVRLAPGALECDTDAVRRAVQAGDAAAVAQLYGGELLPGFFDQWVIEERRHLAALVERTLAGATTPPPSAPPAAALPHARAPRARPAPMTAPIAAPIAAPEPPRHRLPQYLSRLLGFEDAARALAVSVLAQRLVLLRGPGGAGKTRLAVEVARSLAQAEPRPAPGVIEPAAFEFVVFVPLAACTTRAAMLDAVLLALRQDDAAGGADAHARIELALSGRRALLVLDNFEQLVEAGRGDVAQWLSRLPELHLLLTSRRALGLDGEHEQVLQTLPLPPPDAALHELALNPAAALFADRARAVRADFHLGERNHALVAAIVRELQGLPLAIELAAARLRSVTLVDMLAMLQNRAGNSAGGGALALLARSGPRAADDARHASMLRVVEWGWQLLGEAERETLAALSTFDGGATLHAVAALRERPLAEVAALLDDLVASSVAWAGEGSAGHSRFHAFEPVREYVRMVQGDAGRARLALAHLHGMAAWAHTLGPAPALDGFRDELPNLLAALQTAADVDASTLALTMALDCEAAFEDVPLPPSGLELLRRILAAHPLQSPSDVDLASAAHALLAQRSFEAGQREAAVAHAEHAMALLSPSSAHRVGVLYAAARIALRVQNDTSGAQRYIDEALVLAQGSSERSMRARLLVLQAVIAMRVDHDRERDIGLKREALQLWQAQGAPARVTSTTVSLAISLGFARRPLEQLPLLRRVRQDAAAQGQITLLAFALSVQGYVLADLGRWDESVASYLECLATAWAIAAWREWFYALWNLPRTLAHQRLPEAATRLMGFADAFYSQRFGTLGWEDARERRRTRRLTQVQLGRPREAALWQQGRLMTMSEAMALAREPRSG